MRRKCSKPDRRLGFIDKSSFIPDSLGRVLAWESSVYEIPQKDGVRKEKTLYRFDCKKRTMTLLELIAFGNNSRLLKSYSWKSYEQDERYIVPDSVGESKWEFVCLGKSVSETSLKGSPEEFSAYYFRHAD